MFHIRARSAPRLPLSKLKKPAYSPALFESPPPGFTTIALVQSATKNVSGVNNTTLAFPSNVTAGNMLHVAVVTFQSTAGTTITTPTDTLGHTYVATSAQQNGPGDFVHLRDFYVLNCSGGANTVTLDISGAGNGEISVVISEWSGVVTSSAISGTPQVGSGFGADVSSGNTTPAENNCLLIGCMHLGGSPITITEEAGWTLVQKYEGGSNTVTLAVEFKLQTSAVAEDADWTSSVANDWLARVAAFKPAVTAITGVAGITEAGAVASGVGTVPVSGTAGITETPGVAAGVGQLALAAVAAIQEAADVLAATVQVAISGAGGITEAADTSSGGGGMPILGDAGITEAADTATGAGGGGAQAASSITETADALTAAGEVAIAAAADIQEAASTLVAGGAISIAGQAAILQVADVLTSTGQAALIAGAGAITEAPSILTATAKAAIAASGMITESVSILTATATAFTNLFGDAAITEAPDVTGDQAVEAPDSASGTGGVGVTGVGAIQGAPDVAAGTAQQAGGHASIQQAPDVATGTGKVAVAGTATILQFPDLMGATGTAPLQVLIQSNLAAVNGVSGTTLAFPINLTPGNLLVVSQVHFQGAGASIVTTPTDNLHNPATQPYLPMVFEQRTADGLVALRSFYLSDCLGGPCTVNFDIAGTGTGEMTVIVSEWNGRAKVSPVSNNFVATGPVSTTTPSSGDVTPFDDNCLLIAVLNAGGNPLTITPEAGWDTAEEYEGGSNTVTLSMIYKLQVGAPVIEDADWTLSAAKFCLAHAVAFKPLEVVVAEVGRVNSLMQQGHGI